MNALTHFVLGLAAASSVPGAVAAGVDGNPLYFLLGGVCGLLPDVLDTRLNRPLQCVDITVTPDPLDPDAALIADAVAGAAYRVHTQQRSPCIQLNAIRLAADRWQRYDVTFDVPGNAVRVRLGPVVDDTGRPCAASAAGAAETAVAEAVAALPCRVALDRLATTVVASGDGPVIRLEPDAGRVRPVGLPWLRAWTHSLVVAVLCALTGALLWGGMAGVVIAAALGTHILADQADLLGCNLWAPFTRRRTPGFGFARATAAWPNTLVAWTALLWLFWNLARPVTGGIAGLNPLGYALAAGVLPLLSYRLLLRGRP